MLRVAGEVRLWKKADVLAVVNQALEVVEEAAPPAELREAAFVQALGLLAQKNVQLEQIGITPPTMQVPGNGR